MTDIDTPAGHVDFTAMVEITAGELDRLQGIEEIATAYLAAIDQGDEVRVAFRLRALRIVVRMVVVEEE